MKKCNLSAIILLCGAAAVAGNVHDLTGKNVFTKGYPQFLAFRGEMIRASHKDYDSWRASVGDASGLIRKFIPEIAKASH